jgi:hypothetical protein
MNYRLASIIAAFCAAFMVNGCGGGGGEVTSAIPTVPISSAPYELTSSTPANGAVNVDPVNTKEVHPYSQASFAGMRVLPVFNFFRQ